MNTLPKNVRIGRNGRVGILKKIPRDLWPHPRYAGKAKLSEHATGSTDKVEGTKIALEMLARLEIEFSQARTELNSGDFSSPHRGRKPTSASLTQSVCSPVTIPEPLESGRRNSPGHHQRGNAGVC